MRERPILFTAPEVRALLDGAKSQTRRVVKPQPHYNHIISPAWGTAPDGFEFGDRNLWRENGPDYPDGPEDERRCPHGTPGDRLWVRETWAWSGDKAIAPSERVTRGEVWFRADEKHTAPNIRWRPSIHMPRWASRITLDLTAVRVERLQDISEADAVAEGLESYDCDGVTYWGPLNQGHFDPRVAFEREWNSLHPKREDRWLRAGAETTRSPWVWVLEFKRVGT